ncbi:hypothetical protein V8E52_002520 [Russula decolorans]
MPLMWLKCLILILKMAWAKLILFLNGLISKISQNKPVKPVKFFSSFPDAVYSQTCTTVVLLVMIIIMLYQVRTVPMASRFAS